MISLSRIAREAQRRWPVYSSADASAVYVKLLLF
nr:hypothetical protein BYUHJPPR_BYUHJPPR_CDS_0002 [Microvirus sp.]